MINSVTISKLYTFNARVVINGTKWRFLQITRIMQEQCAKDSSFNKTYTEVEMCPTRSYDFVVNYRTVWNVFVTTRFGYSMNFCMFQGEAVHAV